MHSMTFRSICLSCALFSCSASPLIAHSASAEEQAAVPTASAQVKIIKKDANEKILSEQTIALSKAILLASRLAPGAASKDTSAVKTLIITYTK